ncbi:hypothetical protein V1478_013667 [Vespula squamosa]|uniref:Ribulose-1,5-bisphosphate carboxylase/oxygenase large subunit n=1 Tax=Vespula squamosa TaxID=30214 RepID=A0ABD2A5X2_VESSQ
MYTCKHLAMATTAESPITNE